jgi:hypothetical protein
MLWKCVFSTLSTHPNRAALPVVNGLSDSSKKAKSPAGIAGAPPAAKEAAGQAILAQLDRLGKGKEVKEKRFAASVAAGVESMQRIGKAFRQARHAQQQQDELGISPPKRQPEGESESGQKKKRKQAVTASTEGVAGDVQGMLGTLERLLMEASRLPLQYAPCETRLSMMSVAVAACIAIFQAMEAQVG